MPESHIIKKEGEFQYLETNGSGENIVLLHGLLGALSNFTDIISFFQDKYNVVLPILPIYEMPLRKASLSGLLDYLDRFIEFKGFKKIHLLGNSLGGHIAQLYALRKPEKISSLILTGSSGLFENAMGSSFPKRGNYEYIKQKAEDTFYDPKVATKELVDGIFEVVTNRNKAIRIVATAKSAIRHNTGELLHDIKAPTLLIWGKQDEVTPPFVAEKFKELIKNAELHFVDKCGHAPMMEKPAEFNKIMDTFLSKLEVELV